MLSRGLAAKFPDPAWSRGFGQYVALHPTHYRLRDDVKREALRLLSHPELRGHISINTYLDHPPGWHRDTTSIDVWDEWGRGGPLTAVLRKRVFTILFSRKGPPDIAWIIAGGGMWTRSAGWGDAPWGPDGSDPGHWNHVHVTFS